MVRPISSGSESLNNAEVTFDDGPTIRPGAVGANGDRAVIVRREGSLRGTVDGDRYETAPATGGPAATRATQIAVRNGDTRRNAERLLTEAGRHQAGPSISIPSARTSSFQAFVDGQHEEASREIIKSTAAAVVSGGVSVAHEAHALSAGVDAARRAAPGVAAGVVPHASHMLGGAVASATAGQATEAVIDHASGHAHGSVVSQVGHAAGQIAVDVAADAVLGPAGGAVIAQISSVAHTFEDVEARVRFQQAATVQDAARAQAIANQRANQGQGQAAGRLAATNTRPIDWARYERDGDYATGVRQGLTEALNRPGEFVHQYASNTPRSQ